MGERPRILSSSKRDLDYIRRLNIKSGAYLYAEYSKQRCHTLLYVNM